MSDLPPSPAAIDRAAMLAGPGATVQGVLALAGGTHARTYLIQTANPEREFILREFDADDDATRREAQVLTALDGLGGLAPRLLASCPDGPPPHGSWNLISRLPGAADITPDDPAAFAGQLGETLARIHSAAWQRLAGFGSVFDHAGGDPAALSGPAASLVAGSWEIATSAQPVLTHYDFWAGNTVWRDATLTGVVDWTGAALGPRGFDLGWCRLDLFLLFDQRTADRFAQSYQAASTLLLPDLLLYDLWAIARSDQSVESWVPNYSELGRGDLTAPVLRDRHTAWTQLLIDSWTNQQRSPQQGSPGCPIVSVAVTRPQHRADFFIDPRCDPREGGPRLGDERTTLTEFLRGQRLTLALKCDGLDAGQLARRAAEPSTMSLLGLVRHMAEVERGWFRRRFAGLDAPRRYQTEADPDGDFNGAVADPAVVQEAWAAWREEVAYAEEFTNDHDLGFAGHDSEGTPVSLRELLVHMIEEYARHNGHADLLRERIDGRVGQ